MVSGIQGGKTTNGALWARSHLGDLSDPHDNAIIAAPDYKIFSQSTFPKFQEYFSGYGKLDKKEMAFRVNGGGTIYLRSMHDPDSCEGITNVRWIWGDEAGKMKKLAWTNLSGRSAFREAPIFLTTTPYALNWLYKDLYKPYKQGKFSDVLFVQFRSVDNPYFPKAEYERQRRLLDPRDFARKYEGKFEKMAGLVFMDFDETLNMVEPFQTNKRDYFVGAGVDWGYTNAFAISIRAIHRTEPGRDYQLGEFYKSYMTPSEKVVIAKQFQGKYGIETFYCDNEEPAMIKEFNNAGLHAVAAPKYPGSLVDNIARHNTLIRTRDHKIFRGKCPMTEEEYETYHYAEDDGKEELICTSPNAPNISETRPVKRWNSSRANPGWRDY
jgi:PBSX family phage terminase large subunit